MWLLQTDSKTQASRQVICSSHRNETLEQTPLTVCNLPMTTLCDASCGLLHHIAHLLVTRQHSDGTIWVHIHDHDITLLQIPKSKRATPGTSVCRQQIPPRGGQTAC